MPVFYEIAEDPFSYWNALCESIPHLNMRLDMVFEVKFVEDFLEQEYRAPLTSTTVTADVRLSLLWLSHVLGHRYVKKLLEQKPIAFVVALICIYNVRRTWMTDSSVNNRIFLQTFFTSMAFLHEHFYNPQFMQWIAKGRKEANELMVRRVIDEIESSSLIFSQRRVLIDRASASVDVFLGATLHED